MNELSILMFVIVTALILYLLSKLYIIQAERKTINNQIDNQEKINKGKNIYLSKNYMFLLGEKQLKEKGVLNIQKKLITIHQRKLTKLRYGIKGVNR